MNSKKKEQIIQSQNDVTLRLSSQIFINNSIKKIDIDKILHQQKYIYIADSHSHCILSQLLCVIFFNADTIYVSFKYNNNQHMMKKMIL